MSSSTETAQELTETPKETTTTTDNSNSGDKSNHLSLFDQIKNSVDHNCVTRTSLATLNRDENNKITKSFEIEDKKEEEEQQQQKELKEKQEKEISVDNKNNLNNNKNDLNLKQSSDKPEFHEPKLLPPPSGTGAISGLGTVSSSSSTASSLSSSTSNLLLAKRSSNGSMKLNLKPPSSNIREFTSLRSLKRSQQSTNLSTQKTGTPFTSASASGIGSLASSSLVSNLRSTLSSIAAAAAVATDLSIHNAKKKRCTDRYDSSESSDSGVATSLSCTDSSTGSSEDASEPGSPFSLHSSLSEDQQMQQQLQLHQQIKSSNIQQNNNYNKMSPQTILVAGSSSAVTTTTTNNSNHNVGSGSTLPASSTTSSSSPTSSLTSSASLNAAIRSSNLPASLTITPASISGSNGGGGAVGSSNSHSNNMGANKSKLPSTQIAKNSITANTNRCSNLPTLQWPWSSTTNTTSTIPPPSSLTSVSSSSSSFSSSTSTCTNTHQAHTASSNNTSTSSNYGKKRLASHVSGGGLDTPSNAKKARSNANTTFQDGHHVSNAAGAKRLKAAALEESQTKITGYFKSQMKAQIHAANSKMASNANAIVNGGMQMVTTSSSSSNSQSNAAMTTNALTMSAPATTASLNKYFNILAQLKENSKAVNSGQGTNNSAVTTCASSTPPTVSSSSNSIHTPTSSAAALSSISAISTNLTTPPAVTITSTKAQNLTMPLVAMPALKKIERPKPTKIAQVAPNLRKTPSNTNAYPNLSNGTGKSPAKKHVAIAPRTPEMKQQQQQNQLLPIKQEITKTSSNAVSATPGNQTASTPAQQPAVLLTAIRLPPGQQQQQQTTKPPITNNKITQAPNVGTTNNTNNTMAGSTAPNTVANPPATLFQLPAVQLPNLVQLPHLLAANGANLMQLNNIASMAKSAVSTTTTSTSAATSATSAQAAQAAAAQYFLNGTVFKLQQFTTATTTTSTAATTGNGNPYNLLSASDLNDILIKQQQQQQQLQQMQQQQKAAVANATATSFQEIFQQQIAAAIAANQQQQQQAQLQQLQRLGAAANIQQQPVFMATPAGLLLNAASLPAMLAQAAAALAVNTQQQQQQQHQKAIALPALQPIQQAPLPALSSIFAPQTHQQTTDQHDLQQQQQQLAAHLALAQQQFITASQPPPLSSVTIPATNSGTLTHNSVNGPNMATNVNISNSLSTQTSLAPAVSAQSNTAKLAIVKANTVPTTFTTLSSQPPPLVTISNAKPRTHLNTSNTTGTVASQKPSVLSKPYQKRSPKLANQNKAVPNIATAGSKSNAGKITTTSGKIIASPTTPPPLVPTLTACSQQPVSLTSVPNTGIRTAPTTSLTKPSPQLPTPALVSIAPTSTTPIAPKPAQSITCGSVTITPTSATVSGKGLVNIAPKVSTPATNNNSNSNQMYKFNSKPATNINSLLSANKAKVKTTTSDLFDLVKNSNGAISITPAPPTTTTVAAFNSSTNFSAPLNFSASTANFKPSMPLEDFGKIKDEPMDDIPAVTATNPNISASSTSCAESNTEEEKDEIKNEPPTSFTGQIPVNNDAIKEELTNPSTEEEESDKSCSPQPNSLMNNECSSSSFSCNSNSVSSAADLSLEASTPASITSSSEAPSPGRSMLSPLNTSSNQFAAPNPCSNSNSVGYSNSSNSCETPGGASSRDMLSEMVTSTCVSSDTSESSISVSLPDNEEGKQSVDEEKSIDEMENENTKQRDLPTPESGIGGSLSNTESMDSSTKSSNSDTASSAASSTCEQELQSPNSDSQTPPATPLALDSSTSMEETQNESMSQSNSSTEFTTSTSTSDLASPTIDIKLAEVSANALPKCAISPILSQPKTIRFPANKGNKRQDGICYWDKCNMKHDSNSKLLDHMQQHHVNSQTGPFSCLWVGCKVYNKESCSRRWLERHVLSHGGSKQFKCIVEGCGLRFGSQLALQKHVNNHFSATENKESTNKRTSDPPVPKQLRKNGKKLRYRRQPFSARMFDFFDAGIMEGLQHRLRQISTLTNGCNSITFQGQCVMKRKAAGGKTQCYVQWSPREIISDEWLPEVDGPFLKTVNIKQMKPSEKNKVESLLMTAYKLPYSPTIFENDYALSRQHHITTPESNTEKEIEEEIVLNSTSTEDNNGDDNEEDDDDNDEDEDEDEDEDDSVTTTTETISSYQHVLSITNIQMQQRRKHPRKPQSRIIVTR